METTYEKIESSASPWVRSSVRGFWLGIVPFGLALVAFQVLVPRGSQTLPGTLPERVAEVGSEHPVWVFAALFLLLALLVRYWRFYLPGARFLSSLPESLSRGKSAAYLALAEPFAEVLAWLSASGVQRRVQTLEPGTSQRVQAAAGELQSALRREDWSGAVEAHTRLMSVGESLFKAKQYTEIAVLVLMLVVAGAGARLFRANAFESYRVLSSSMLPSLQAGDHLGALKVSFSDEQLPQRGDVILFPNPNPENGPESLVKRVVGLPGDRIQMHGGVPAINGFRAPICDAGMYNLLAEDGTHSGRVAVEWLDGRAFLTLQSPLSQRGFNYTYVVQSGEVFVLGDNREISEDSRSWNKGRGAGVPLGAITGRVDWVVLGTKHGDAADYGRIFERLGVRLNLQGVDEDALRQGVEECLQHPPPAARPEEHTSKFDCGDGELHQGEECDDGNATPGDGCDATCRTETWSCERCSEFHCGAFQTACSDGECKELLACMDRTGCASTSSMICYCGAGVAAGPCTVPGNAAGPCRQQVEAAAHSADPSHISATYTDTGLSLGKAIGMVECQRSHCSVECRLSVKTGVSE